MSVEPTRQDTAIVVCGGGKPFEEYAVARELCAKADRNVTIFAGNDMIEKLPDDIAHAVSLHPDKLQLWLPGRRASGLNDPDKVWAHRNYEGAVTHWTRDWSGSTGLFCVKIARELGFVHVILCGVHMTVEGNHFVRDKPWVAALGFRRGWIARLKDLQPYVRSYGGWTREQLGAPTEEWLRQDIEDRHVNRPTMGQRA
jgi:hypothetical protein